MQYGELKQLVPVCDFCSEPDVQWSYPCKEMTVRGNQSVVNLTGDWAACPTCHDLIEADDRDGLLARHMASEWIENVPVNDRMYEKVVRSMHNEFFFTRTGPAITEEEYQATTPQEIKDKDGTGSWIKF